MVGTTAVVVLAACGGGDASSSDTTSGGGGSDTTLAGGSDTTSGGATAQKPNHYRLSSRHSRKTPCKACTSHINSRFYATAEAAEADRPHEGCHCKVRGRVASDADLEKWFGNGDQVYDSRKD